MLARTKLCVKFEVLWIILYYNLFMKKKISILGSTGSIGRQALEVIEKLNDKFEIIALTAGQNVDLLNKQIEKFKPKYAYADDKDTIIGAEYKTLDEICSDKENDIILVAVSGKIGLKPTITAINNGIDIALANKETLVMAGDIVIPLAKEKGVNIVPVDSEHCAIHQCIKNILQVKKLIITASGGPFLHKSVDEMNNATVEQALAHPRWNMGKKITIDSATLMNKGLEVIEAHHLFGMDYKNIEVVIHPQSIVHSAIEYVDGSVIAQLGLPSMHIPIQYAITYPERFEGIKSHSFSFAEIARLDFEEPNRDKFKALDLAYQAGISGGSATVCLNAANEEAVFEFLAGEIKLFEIVEAVEYQMSKHNNIKNPSMDEIFEIDKEIRIKTREWLNSAKV
jgi:1-deoxy-D-xylulose-5-phosphate reductoisomerase